VQIPAICTQAGILGEANVSRFQSIFGKMLHSPVLETAVRELMDKAQGLFLYASLLARQLEAEMPGRKKLDFKDLRGLPTGLSEVYEENFERMVQSSRQDWDEHYSPLIVDCGSSRASAQHCGSRGAPVSFSLPLPLSISLLSIILFSLFCWCVQLVGPGCETLEQKLSVLFPVREGRFQVMHKSVADWLRDCERKSSLYKISEEDVRTAHRRMVEFSCNQGTFRHDFSSFRVLISTKPFIITPAFSQ